MLISEVYVSRSCTCFFVAVARKPSHDRCSDKEKTSLERSKNVAFEKKSTSDQDADASGKRELKTEGDEEGKALKSSFFY